MPAQTDCKCILVRAPEMASNVSKMELYLIGCEAASACKIRTMSFWEKSTHSLLRDCLAGDEVDVATGPVLETIKLTQGGCRLVGHFFVVDQSSLSDFLHPHFRWSCCSTRCGHTAWVGSTSSDSCAAIALFFELAFDAGHNGNVPVTVDTCLKRFTVVCNDMLPCRRISSICPHPRSSLPASSEDIGWRAVRKGPVII